MLSRVERTRAGALRMEQVGDHDVVADARGSRGAHEGARVGVPKMDARLCEQAAVGPREEGQGAQHLARELDRVDVGDLGVLGDSSERCRRPDAENEDVAGGGMKQQREIALAPLAEPRFLTAVEETTSSPQAHGPRGRLLDPDHAVRGVA